MEDVTKRVQASVKEGMSDADSLMSRQAEIARIEKESLDKTGLRSNIISLYQGGEYWLYRFKKYTDVRLVMAPERQAAYYGGDFDNFTYPRYDLDMAYFRVYENGKPIKCDHYLRWNPKGLSEGDLVFVSGNPGSTDRLYTYAQLEFQRDLNYPMILGFFDRYIQVLREYSALGKEQERRALIQIFGLENSKKAMTGEFQGLLDKALMAGRKKAEEEFRLKVASNPEWDKAYGDAWDTIAEVAKKMTTLAKRQFFRRFIGSDLAGFAASIVRYVVEAKKPDADRIPGYHDSELNELRFSLFSPAPIYLDLEERLLANGLKWSLDALGPDDEFMKTVLDGNIESLSGRFAFDETKNRAVAVHCAYMLEGLRKLYDAAALADEIEGDK